MAPSWAGSANVRRTEHAVRTSRWTGRRLRYRCSRLRELHGGADPAETRRLTTIGAWLFIVGSVIYTLAAAAQLVAVVYELGSTLDMDSVLSKKMSTE